MEDSPGIMVFPQNLHNYIISNSGNRQDYWRKNPVSPDSTLAVVSRSTETGAVIHAQLQVFMTDISGQSSIHFILFSLLSG